MAAEYYLIIRKNTQGEEYYHAAFLSGEAGKNGRPKYRAMRKTGIKVRRRNDKPINESDGHKAVQKIIADGRVFAARNDLRAYLMNFWTPGRSDYLRSKEARGQTLSTQYLDAHRSAIERHFLPFFKNKRISRLDELTPGNLEQWQNWCRLDKGVSVRTTNRTRQAVWTALQYAVDRDLLPYHPGDKIKPLPEEKPQRKIFETAEIEKLFEQEWPDFRVYAAFALAECTGMRLGEIRGLLVKNVYLDEGYVDILTNYVEPEGLKHPKQHKDGRPDILISERAVEALRPVIDDHRYGARPDDFVFFSLETDRKPISKEAIAKGFRDAVSAAGLAEGRTFHCLRHSAVSHYGALMSPGQRLRYFGHSSIEMNLHYSKETDQDRKKLRKAQNKIIKFRKAQ